MKIKTVLIITFALILLHSQSYAANYVCGKDLNNDGDVDDQGETAQCVETLEGQLCPIGLVNCNTNFSCPVGGSYDAISKKCIAPAEGTLCPLEYTYNNETGQCEAAPTTIYSCPLGPQYACMNNNGTYQCSPNQCVDLDINPPEEDSSDQTSYQNDGQIDSQGNCLGQIYIFNGKPGECRTPGVNTTFFNCCSNKEDSFLFFKKYCKDEEWETNAARDAERCHYIGEYCKTRWPIIGCVQKAKVYCCMNSKLGRIIHEQGRLQLKKFAPDGQWGSAEDPNCVGFTPEEFQMLDFSKIDLSEYFADIQTKAIQQVQQNMEDKINEFYQNTQ